MASLRRALSSTIPRILNTTAVSGARSIPAYTISSQTLCRPFLGSFSRFLSSYQSLHVDLADEESKRRLFNRLIYRSKQRGFLELDLILGKWVEDHIRSMDENGIKSLIDILDLENPDLWKWLTGQEQPPDAISTNQVFSALHEKVMNNLNNHSAPETRATPGQPWVRGWDDIKRSKDGPICGNQ